MSEKDDIVPPKYPMDFVLVPCFRAMICCPKCNSREVKVFPNAVFIDEGCRYDGMASFIHTQVKCKSCGVFFTASNRVRVLDTFYSTGPTTGTGRMSFSTTTVDYNPEEVVNEIDDSI
jgi:hypothetical protein